MEVLLATHKAQNPGGVWVVSTGHAKGHCKVKCSFFSMKLVWWSLHCVLRPGWAGGLGGVWFCYAPELLPM